MANTSFSPTDIPELLSGLVAFVSSELGWSASWSSGQAVVTPQSGGATFTLSEATWGYQAADSEPSIRMVMTEGADTITTDIADVTSTSQVWLHGGNSPEPWLMIVVMTEPGVYRLGYLGYIVKYGTWSGGATVDSCQFGRSSSSIYVWNSSASHMLFSSNTSWSQSYRRDENLGGVFVRGVHGESPVVRFCSTTGIYPADAPRGGGGYVDDYARRASEPGVNPLSGEAALVPFTLFADMLRNGTWTPLGHVPGIRMMDISDFDPGSLYSYAGQSWRVFPLARKTGDPYNTGSLGVAVLEE